MHFPVVQGKGKCNSTTMTEAVFFLFHTLFSLGLAAYSVQAVED